MKKIIGTFELSSHKKIELYFPDSKNKFNYYYKPTTKLHRFDVIMATYFFNGNFSHLYDDELRDALVVLSGQLQSAQQGMLELPSFIKIGQFSYHFNEARKENPAELYHEIDFSNYWVWSQPQGKPQTFMYTVNRSIYLEIGLFYKWYTIEDFDFDTMLYNQFIKDYKPVAVEQISVETAKQWLKQCEELLKQIE